MSRKKKICFIAQFPPPIHGLSKAVDTLYHSKLRDSFDFAKADLTNNKRFLHNLRTVCRSKADLFYFTISQTKGGNLRDLIIFELLSFQKKKCLVHLHGGYYRKLVEQDMPSWQRKANYRAVGRLSGAIALSESLGSIFQGMLPDNRIQIVPNCVEDAFTLCEQELHAKITRQKSKEILHVLYLSNFIKTKGYPETLELARLEQERVLAGERRRFHFDFAGAFFQEEERTFFNTYVKDHGLEALVTYHGPVDGDRKRDILKSGDIFVLLTRYPNEGQPISILEAMANGLFILTTRAGGIPDLVKDGVNGALTDGSVRSAHEVLGSLQVDDLAKIARANWLTCEERYRARVYLENMRELFYHA